MLQYVKGPVSLTDKEIKESQLQFEEFVQEYKDGESSLMMDTSTIQGFIIWSLDPNPGDLGTIERYSDRIIIPYIGHRYEIMGTLPDEAFK